MIAERVISRGEHNSFKRRAAYVTNEPNKGRGDPTTWKLVKYVIDAKHQGQKVETIRVTNCKSVDTGWAVKECLALEAQNTRSKKDKSYHLVVSFPEGEKPTLEQMIDIEDEVVKAIGLQNHKRISATHVNTPNFHIHIVICTVHSTTFRNVQPYFDFPKLQTVCHALELKHGLQVDNHTRDHAFAKWIRENARDDLIQALQRAQTWADLHQAMSRHGLVIKPRGAGLVIATADNKAKIKASEVDRMFSFKSLTDRFGTYQRSEPPAHEQPSASYVRTPGVQALWDRYQARQTNLNQARTQAMTELRLRQLEYAQELDDWYRQRFANALAQHLSRADRTQTFRTLASQQKADRLKRRERERQERADMRAQYRVLSWTQFLESETTRGDRGAAQAIERSIEREADRGGSLGR
jgi:hypothetical protein